MKTLIALAMLCTACAFAQEPHQHQHPETPPPSQKKEKTQEQDKTQEKKMPPMQMPEHAGHTMPEHAPMHAVALHAQFSSGTAWQPAAAPSPMWMTMRGAWDLMAHGNVFVTYNQQGGPRGVGKLESMNWAMLMEQRQLGPGTLLFRQMFSAEALTAPHAGFPQLFQTGETYRQRPLVDRQHPHDVFGELSVLYAVPLGERVSWFGYGGPAGEPALGPVAFMHRASAAEIPAAPLGHHLQDSTHISYGVVTTGFVVAPRGGALKLEGSAFNGREPDERRATIDLGPLDSWALRVGANLNPRWSAQYSVGHLVHPEALEPGDTLRQTASVAYSRALRDGHWCTTLLWGRNRKEQEHTTQNGYLLESVVNFAQHNYGFTRMELVDKDELFAGRPAPEFDPTFPPGRTLAAQPTFRIGAFTFGGVRDVVHNHAWQIGLGAGVTFYEKPAALDASYGRNPVSLQLFVRMRPGGMDHQAGR